MEFFESESQIDDDAADGGNNEDLNGVGYDDIEKDDDEDDCCDRWRFSQHVGPKLSAPLLSPETNDEDLLDISTMVRVTTMVVLVMILFCINSEDRVKLISEQIDILVNSQNRDMQNMKGNVEPICLQSPTGVFGTQSVRTSQMNTIYVNFLFISVVPCYTLREVVK